MRNKIILSFILTFVLLHSPLFALFDTGTAMDKGKLELDFCVNPFDFVEYGQNYIFWHYGLGDGWETHGYASKYGYITNWDSTQTYELYSGILKQFYSSEYLDLAASIGLRKVFVPYTNFSVFGPSLLYTFKINRTIRIAGHIMPITDVPRDGSGIGFRPLNRGYTTEIGAYFRLNEHAEIAFGAFTTTASRTTPIYTFNWYF